MLRHLFLVVIVALLGCQRVETLPTNYQGSDFGRVVIGMGEKDRGSLTDFRLRFRKIEDSRKEKSAHGTFLFDHNNTWSSQKLDHDSEGDHGVVVAATLVPGEYEIFNYDIFINNYPSMSWVNSKRPFSFVFIVRPGEITYLGTYQYDAKSTPIIKVYNRSTEDLQVAGQKFSKQLDGFINAVPMPYKNIPFPQQK